MHIDERTKFFHVSLVTSIRVEYTSTFPHTPKSLPLFRPESRCRRSLSHLRILLQQVCGEQSRCVVQKIEVTECLPLIETVPARGLWLTKKWDSQLKRGVIERHRDGNTGLSLCVCVCVCGSVADHTYILHTRQRQVSPKGGRATGEFF